MAAAAAAATAVLTVRSLAPWRILEREIERERAIECKGKRDGCRTPREG